MPSAVNTQTSSIVNNIGGGWPDGVNLNNPRFIATPIVTVAAAGTTQATATAATGTFNIVTGASGTNGVILPATTAGSVVYVYSSAATNALLVYPPTGGSVNNGTANASSSVTARTLSVWISTDGTSYARI